MFEGWTSPFAEEAQKSQDRATAWDAIKADPGSAALIAGLSMLANNNGSRSFGQLVGRAGFDTLAGLGSMEAQRQAQERQAGLDAERRQYRDMQMQGMQAELDEQKRRRELQERFASGDESALKALDPIAWWKNEQSKEQAAQSLRNSMALEAFKMKNTSNNKGQYDSKLGGYVHPDGSFTPIRLPEGYEIPNATKAMPFDQASKLAGIESSYKNIQDLALGLFDDSGNFKRGTAFAGMIPGTDAAEYEKKGTQAMEAWLRAMTGAAVTEEELDKYTSMYLPMPWDSEAVALDKLARLEENYTGTLTNMGMSSRIPSSAVSIIKERRKKSTSDKTSSISSPYGGLRNEKTDPPLPPGALPLNF